MKDESALTANFVFLLNAGNTHIVIQHQWYICYRIAQIWSANDNSRGKRHLASRHSYTQQKSTIISYQPTMEPFQLTK